MGRKGVSKRKEKKTKVSPVMNDAAAGSVSAVVRASEGKPGKSLEIGKDSASIHTGKKNSNKK